MLIPTVASDAADADTNAGAGAGGASHLGDLPRHLVPLLRRQEMVPGGLSLFDFSERKQSNRAADVVHADQLGGKREDGDVLVTRVGDAREGPDAECAMPWREGDQTETCKASLRMTRGEGDAAPR